MAESRWPMAIAVVVAGLQRAALPSELRNGDAQWIGLAVLIVILGVLITSDSGRIDRDKRWLRRTTGTLIGAEGEQPFGEDVETPALAA